MTKEHTQRMKSHRIFCTHIHTKQQIGTNNIAITEEACARLASQETPSESYTDVVNRLTGKKSVLDLTGLLSKSEGKGMRAEIRKVRKQSQKRIAATKKKMMND
jgi:predicted CopG family antitoxin